MINRELVLKTLHGKFSELQKFGVKSIAIFGSVARNEAGPESDLDILVDFIGPATYDQYYDLRQFLEQLFQRKIDLVTVKALKPRLRSAIENDLRYVA